jgi:P-type Cu2+ transporter
MNQLTLNSQSLYNYTVIHAIPGRIRLKFAQFPRKITELLTRVSWIESFRINQSASSVVINYTPQKTPNIDYLLAEILPNIRFQELTDHPLFNQNEKVINYDSNLSQKIEKQKENKSSNNEEKDHQWSSLTLPVLATVLALASNRLNLPLLRLMARGTLIIATLPVAKRALESIFIERKLNIDCLDLMALILSGLQGKLVTPALVITLHELGDLIREHTARATEQKTANLLDTIGRFAWVEREGKIIQIPSDQVLVNETVIVYPGERIPVDGIVLKGIATIDQQQLTGESMPIVAQEGSHVYASTLVRSGQIRLQCEMVGSQTRAAASIELLEKAPVHDTRMANYAAKLADKLIVPSMLLAGIVYGTTQDPTRTASILTLDFVTGIRVSMPTAFLGALNHTTRHGILVRSGRTMELLAEIDTVVFDKTGTLTEGDIKVVGVETVSQKVDQSRLLQLVASVEQRITHPVAEAIVIYAEAHKIEILPRKEWNYVVGSGMEAEIDGLDLLVGSEKFLREKGVNLDNNYLENLNQKSVKEWLSVVYIACDGEFIGTIQYNDPLRSESYSLIYELQHHYGSVDGKVKI